MTTGHRRTSPRSHCGRRHDRRLRVLAAGSGDIALAHDLLRIGLGAYSPCRARVGRREVAIANRRLVSTLSVTMALSTPRLALSPAKKASSAKQLMQHGFVSTIAHFCVDGAKVVVMPLSIIADVENEESSLV
jgi:hypothetical protein